MTNTELTPRKSAWRWPSIQHYGYVRGLDACWLETTYFTWIDNHVPLVRAVRTQDEVSLRILPFRTPAIALARREAEPERVVLQVTGGWLADGPDAGTFEFEKHEDGGVRVVLRDYRPALPRIVYFLTQAMLHAVVMWIFGLYLRRQMRD